MADILFKCPKCSKHLVVDGSASGKGGVCVDCRQPIRVPNAAVAFKCPSCSCDLSAPLDIVGERFDCPNCRAALIVPQPEERPGPLKPVPQHPTLQRMPIKGKAFSRTLGSQPQRQLTLNPEADRCCICGCKTHWSGGYVTPTLHGLPHATRHHFVAERFFGRSTSRRGDHQDRLFQTCPWGVEGKTGVFCYDCHELLIHNPVFLPEDLERLARLMRDRQLDGTDKAGTTETLAGRIKLLHEVIARGLASCLGEADGQVEVTSDAGEIKKG